jgi:hypothetical protein
MLLALAVIAVAGACAEGTGPVVNPKANVLRPFMATVEPTFVAGNPTCASLGYENELKVDPPNSGTYSDGLLTVTVTTADGIYFDWTSNQGIIAVIVKGGPNANAYVYYPPTLSTGDNGLHSPINPSNGEPFGLSHISFCYDEDIIILQGLQVTKTADTKVDRDWDWTIVKTGDQTELTLSPGQQFLVNYEVTVDADYEDTNKSIYGSISIKNTNPSPPPDGHDFNITIKTVTDLVAPGFNGTVECPVTLPYSLDEQATLVCTYEALAWGDETSGTNVATVNAEVGDNDQDFDSDDGWDFALATIDEETDECIDVTDDLYGALGTVCAGDAPKVFSYSRYVGGYEACGEFTDVNVASFTTNDNGETGSDNHTIAVDVPCGTCTLTPGYWKTHSREGPAPYDNTWALLNVLEEDTPFFLSGKTYYEVLWTAPNGNVYYILAHAYIAAQLNILNGSSVPVGVQTALNAATTFFNTYTPAQAAALSRATRNTFIAHALTLDNYNNGVTGPGHCSE